MATAVAVNDVDLWRELSSRALWLASAGIPVFPCTLDKKPVLKSWAQAASTNWVKVNNWWCGGNKYLPAIPTGAKVGFFVLDVDVPKKENDADGHETIRGFVAKYGPLPPTRMQTTPSGGVHYFFKMPADGRDIRNSAKKIASGLDIRGTGGYVCYYGFNNDFDFAEAPGWLLDLIEKSKKKPDPGSATNTPPPRLSGSWRDNSYLRKVIEDELARLCSAPKGERNATLNDVGFNLARWVASSLLGQGEARDMLIHGATATGLIQDDGLNSVLKTIESAMTAGMQKPRTIPEPEVKQRIKADKPVPQDKKVDDPVLTEEMIAAEFATEHKNKLRYCLEKGAWLEWDSTRHLWVKDRKNKTFHYVRMVCKRLNVSGKPSLAKAVTASGVERFARADPVFATVSEEWDCGNMLMGTPEGVQPLQNKGEHLA